MYEVNGIDVSKWQGEVAWEVALQQGVTFAFIRASEGNKQVDPQFERNMQETARLGIPRGIYHYFKPGRDWQKQVELFSELAKGTQFELDPVVDVEVDDGLTKNDLNNNLAKFITHCESAIQRQLMIYTSPGFFNSQMPLTDYAWRRKLWVAHWTKASAPLVPDEWSNHKKSWTFWQHSSQGNNLGSTYGVATKSVSLSRYNGDREKFIQAYQLASLPEPPGGTPPDPDPLPEPPPNQGPVFQVITSALHLFSGPRLDAPIVGNLAQGDELQIQDLSGTDEVWVQTLEGGWCLYAYNGRQLLKKVGG